MSETVHIPQLRFPEFSEGWEENKLGDIATFSKGKGISKSDIDDDGRLECIRYGELYTTYNELIKDIYSRTNIAEEDANLSQSGDVIIPASGETAIDIATASCVLKDGVAIGGDLNIIRSDIDGVFNAYYLNNKNKYSVARLSQGSSVIHLYHKHLEILKLNLPTKPEQQKIAAFLTVVDTKIEQLSKKQELLGEYKKGLMQKIFSQVIRFKADDGSDFPDWEEKRLEDVAEIVGGGTPPTAVEKYWGGDIQWFTPTEIKSKYMVNSKRTITQVGLDTSSARLLPKGTLLFSSRATVGEIGIAVQECTTNQGFQSFIVNKNNEPEFLYNWIIKNKKEFIRRASGSTFLEIGKSEIKKIKLHIPALPEQTKIANFLSSIDNKIEQVGKQLDESKQFKKALLQQMFV
jgi:type I restriction enzyme S subunit